MAVAYTGKRETLLTLASHQMRYRSACFSHGFSRDSLRLPFIRLVPKIPILAGELLDVVREPVILNKDVAPKEDGCYFPHPALEGLA